MNVFDASAVLAVLNEEPGAAAVIALMAEPGGLIGAVNQSEVIAKLIDKGLSEDQATLAWSHLGLRVEPATEATALAAGLLRKQTRPLGLSLGDRFCLALARSLGGNVVTADKAWKSLKGFRITMIR